ncbi:small ribosomal subunit protein uS17m [Anabrus simplex]|uniref:small ribosomal subunit protein uS17m n=1 Tax=Anabrus simplex TaxID=316456 RepID=UPI0034DDADF8
MAGTAVRRSFLLLGQCVPSLKQNASKIRVKRLELDKNLLMYFKKDDFFYAHDPEKKCKSGDIVLIQELPEKLTTLITHKVLQVVYPLGDITDPITGKKVVVGQYRDQIAAVDKMFGEAESRFDYEDAPERGWQEDKKDFTHKPSYIKYHEFPDDDQPYAV